MSIGARGVGRTPGRFEGFFIIKDREGQEKNVHYKKKKKEEDEKKKKKKKKKEEEEEEEVALRFSPRRCPYVRYLTYVTGGQVSNVR